MTYLKGLYVFCSAIVLVFFYSPLQTHPSPSVPLFPCSRSWKDSHVDYIHRLPSLWLPTGLSQGRHVQEMWRVGSHSPGFLPDGAPPPPSLSYLSLSLVLGYCTTHFNFPTSVHIFISKPIIKLCSNYPV